MVTSSPFFITITQLHISIHYCSFFGFRRFPPDYFTCTLFQLSKELYNIITISMILASCQGEIKTASKLPFLILISIKL